MKSKGPCKASAVTNPTQALVQATPTTSKSLGATTQTFKLSSHKGTAQSRPKKQLQATIKLNLTTQAL
jgi:hypothetical protein